MPRSPAGRNTVTLLWVLSLLVVSCTPASAMHAWNTPGDSETAVSVRADYGFLEGEAREIVYDYALFGGTYKASELIWDLSGLTVAGAVMSFTPADRWGVHAGAWTCVNKGNGGMVDYDWAFEGFDWTDRSISDVEVLSSYMIDVNVTYDFFKQKSLILSAVAGYKQDFWEWDDSIVELLYSMDGFRDYYKAGDGSNMIDYQQLFRIPYLGVNSVCLCGAFRLNAYLLYSPFVMAEDEDYHIARDTRFKESFAGGNYLGAGVAGQYDITSSVFVSALLDVQSIPEFTGDMNVTDELGDTYAFSDSAGISHTSAMLSASIGLRF